MLKEIVEKLKLAPPSYECEKSGQDHEPSFIVKVKFEDMLEKHEQYRFKVYIKKEAENEAQ